MSGRKSSGRLFLLSPIQESPKNHFLRITVFSLCILAIGYVGASEEDELRELAERHRLEARKSSGDEAVRLLEEAEALERQALQIIRDPKVRQPRDRVRDREREAQAILEKLANLEEYRKQMATELRDDHPEIVKTVRAIETLKTELNELTIGEHPQEPREREEIARRIEHLHGAAGHLDEAGLPDMARELRQQAENLERELHQRQPGGADRELLRELMEQMRDMKQEVEKLRDEVAELREQLPRANK
jgi:uncharacterized coiled-coil DUF342 family protein